MHKNNVTNLFKNNFKEKFYRDCSFFLEYITRLNETKNKNNKNKLCSRPENF